MHSRFRYWRYSLWQWDNTASIPNSYSTEKLYLWLNRTESTYKRWVSKSVATRGGELLNAKQKIYNEEKYTPNSNCANCGYLKWNADRRFFWEALRWGMIHQHNISMTILGNCAFARSLKKIILYCHLTLLKRCNLAWILTERNTLQWRIQDFPDRTGGVHPRSGATDILFGKNVAENSMKMRHWLATIAQL